MKYKFIVPGQPFGKQRPRKSFKLKGLYTPKETTNYEAYVRNIANKQASMIDKPLRVDITAYFEIPKSFSKKRRQACLAGLEKPTKKPDKDNIEKVILDGMNPLFKTNKATHKKEMVVPGFYQDDKQVIDGFTRKLYGSKACVLVEVEEMAPKRPIKYQKGKWYYINEDGNLEPVWKEENDEDVNN